MNRTIMDRDRPASARSCGPDRDGDGPAVTDSECRSAARAQDGREVRSKMFSISSVAFWTQSHDYTWITAVLHRGVS